MLPYSLHLIITALRIGQVLLALLLLQCCPLALCAAAWQSSLSEGIVRNTTLRGGQVMRRPLARTCCRCTACDSFSLNPMCSRLLAGASPRSRLRVPCRPGLRRWFRLHVHQKGSCAGRTRQARRSAEQTQRPRPPPWPPLRPGTSGPLCPSAT